MGGNSASTSADIQASSTSGDQGNLGKWYALSQGVTALATLAGGGLSMSAARAEAELQERQASIAMDEARRDATQKAREVSRFQAKQAQSYASSGVTLEGTPIDMLEQTRREGQEEVDAIFKRGEAQKELLYMKAKILRRSGRNAMLGSVLGAGAKGIDGYILGRRLGMYGNGNGSEGGVLGDFEPKAPNDDWIA